MDREALRAIVHGVTESGTTEWLNWAELKGKEGTKAKEPQSYLAGYVCLMLKKKKKWKRRTFWSELGWSLNLVNMGGETENVVKRVEGAWKRLDSYAEFGSSPGQLRTNRQVYKV